MYVGFPTVVHSELSGIWVLREESVLRRRTRRAFRDHPWRTPNPARTVRVFLCDRSRRDDAIGR